jgi:uncharacterized LabA/DUF88 family protein
MRRGSHLKQRVGVFVDVQNLFYSARALHHGKINFKKLLEYIVGGRELTRAIAYIVQKPDSDQSGFIEALTSIGYEIKSKELRIRLDGTAKGDWDMGIAIDALAIASKLDVVVLVSGDGDFVPLVEMLKAQGCKVEVVSFEKSSAVELISSATEYIAIEKSMLLKG